MRCVIHFLNEKEAIVKELRSKYKIDEYFYPHISMEIDMSYGLEGEIDSNIKILQEAGFKVNNDNIFYLMHLKKELWENYISSNEGNKILQDYRKLISEFIKPIGAIFPSDLLFIDAIVIVILYLASKFFGSFFEEAGKISARKLLDKDKKKIMKKIKITDIEYEFLKSNLIKLFNDDDKMKIVVENITRIKAHRKKKE